MDIGTLSTLLGGIFGKKDGGVKPASLQAPTDPNAQNPASQNELDKAQKENDENALPGWVSATAKTIDYMTRQNAAREADLQSQRMLSAGQATNAMGMLPGLSGMTASGLARARGLNSVAGI